MSETQEAQTPIEANIQSDIPSIPESTETVETPSEPVINYKWGGKFDNPKQLEEHYNKLQGTVGRENAQLKKELESLKVVPEKYQVPDDIAFTSSEEIEFIDKLARNSQLNQTSYDKLLREYENDAKQSYVDRELKKKEIGEDNINLITDFVQELFPVSLQSTVLNQAIRSKDVMTDLLSLRDKALNSSTPGMSTAQSGSTSATETGLVTDKEVRQAYENMRKYPNKPEYKQHYFDVNAKLAVQNGIDKKAAALNLKRGT